MMTSRRTTSADGSPHNRRGRKPRSPQPVSPSQDLRQTQAFELHVDGWGARKIAKHLGVNRGTVALDIQMEGQRRARELKDQREAQIAMSVARYESVILHANNEIADLSVQIEEERAKPDSVDRPRLQAMNTAEQAMRGHERVIIEAQTRIDELFGLTVRPARS